MMETLQQGGLKVPGSKLVALAHLSGSPSGSSVHTLSCRTRELILWYWNMAMAALQKDALVSSLILSPQVPNDTKLVMGASGLYKITHLDTCLTI